MDSRFWRVVLVEDSTAADWDAVEFYLLGNFDTVWKQAVEMLEDSRYREVFVYRPSDDSLCYHAQDWFGPVTGRFIGSAAA